MSSVKSIFHSQGELSLVISGYHARQEQIDMAEAVDNAINKKNNLVVEAGTGTGKTFAYLVPAIKSGKKVIVSTGTKNLQEQLYFKDLPLIKEALLSSCSTALLKGRANYLCEHRLDLYRESREQLSGEQLQELVNVVNWATKTVRGDISELGELSEKSSLFPYITSTVDNCLGKDCPFIDTCYLVKARQEAMNADIVVVNHHLFFADMALKDIGFGELIPQVDVVIFDEAHQVPEIACRYFGDAFSTRQIIDLCHDVEKLYRTELNDMKQLSEKSRELVSDAQHVRSVLPEYSIKGHINELAKLERVETNLFRMINTLEALKELLRITLGRSEDGDKCCERCSQLLLKCEQIFEQKQADYSYWFESTNKYITFHQTPLSISEKFSNYINQLNSSWIFTSATLSVENDVSYFSKLLGIESSRSLLLDSPFDYLQQALLYVPRYLPETFEQNRASRLVELAVPLFETAKGRSFFLFTSYKVMYQVAELLNEAIDWPIFIQGDKPKSTLLEEFLSTENSILLATSSFWEGVDVKGDKLICVIIDKLPFGAPDEPFFQSKAENNKANGGNPFTDIQIPQAVIALKQGVGRLIRGASDRGLMVICDSRIVNRNYGGTFLGSLPNMRRTREETKSISFLEEISNNFNENKEKPQ